MKSTAILELMVKDHGRLITLLNNVEKSMQQDADAMLKAFDSFEWALEKHIFTEEKAIFTSYRPANTSADYKMLPELIKEHNEIINKLRVMRREIITGHYNEFTQFKELLMNHKNFEEQQLYPKIDQNLSIEDKQRIINRIQEIV